MPSGALVLKLWDIQGSLGNFLYNTKSSSDRCLICWILKKFKNYAS